MTNTSSLKVPEKFGEPENNGDYPGWYEVITDASQVEMAGTVVNWGLKLLLKGVPSPQFQARVAMGNGVWFYQTI